MGITNLIGKLFGAGAAAPPDATKLDGTTEATLARSVSALSPDERGWITFAEAAKLFSAERAEYAFGELDQDGRKAIESFAAQHQSVISFMPVEGRVYFARDPTAADVRFTPESGHPPGRSLFRLMHKKRTSDGDTSEQKSDV